MNLLVFEPYPDSGYGGQEKSLFEVCQGLAERGMAITLLSGADGNLLPRYEKFCRNLIRLPGPFFFQRSKSLAFPSNLSRLIWLNQSNHWDAIYVNQYGDAPLAAAIGWLLRIPVVAHLRLPPGAQLSRQYKFALRHCAELIAISQFTRQQYIETGLEPDKLHVIYNGTDLEYFTPVAKPATLPRRILYLGRVCPTKGIDTLMDAFVAVHLQRPDVSMLIAGEQNEWGEKTGYLNELRRKAAGNGGAISFLPHQHDVRPLLAGSDLLILPSNWGEPFGRVLIEAMAMGIPVIATRDGGIPEVLSNRFDAHLVPPGKPDALAAAILKFIDWRFNEPSLGPEFRSYVESRFSQTQTHDRIFSLITNVVG